MTLEEEVKAWIDRISVVREDLAHLPACPFARGAWLHGDVAVGDWRSAPTHLVSTAVLRTMLNWTPDHKVVVLVFRDMPVDHLLEPMAHTYSREFIAIPDHPDMPLILPGFDTAFGRPCVVVQGRRDFERARWSLRRHHYYDNWNSEALKAVGATREDA